MYEYSSEAMTVVAISTATFAESPLSASYVTHGRNQTNNLAIPNLVIGRKREHQAGK